MSHGRLRSGVRGGSARTAGLVAALVMGLVSAAVIGYFLVWGGGARGTKAAEPQVAAEAPPVNILDISRSRDGRPGAALQGTLGLSAQFASKSDPSRLAGRIVSASLEPLEAKRYHAEKPEAFIYLKDGRTLHVRSDTARLFMPNGEAGQPESGTLSGNVRIGVFAARADGKEIVPGVDWPELLVSAPGDLVFDLTVGEGRIPERLTVTSDQVEYAGRDLTILYNQPKERLDLVKVVSSEGIRIRTREGAAKGAPTTGAGGAGTGGAVVVGPPSPGLEPAGKVLETFYHAVFSSDVAIVHGRRRVNADGMELWAHLINNALAPGAIAPLQSPGKVAGGTAAPGDAGRTEDPHPALSQGEREPRPGVAAPVAAPKDVGVQDEDVVITWAGPLEIRPADQRPEAMGSDELAMRFTGTGAGRVTLDDPDLGAAGRAQSLHYGATSRELVFDGPGARGVLLALPKSGHVSAGNVRVNVGTGLAKVSGRGVLVGAPPEVVGPMPDAPAADLTAGVGDEGQRFISWADGAEFKFAVRNGAMTGRLESATIDGRVVAADGAASLSGQRLKAWFAPVGKDSSVLKRLEAHELVQGGDGRGGSLLCDDLGVDFKARAEDPARSDPTGLAARGLVVFNRLGSTLEGGLVEASLGLDENGRTQVRDVVAREAVRFERLDGVRAWADELRADVRGQVVDLLGRHAAVAKGPTKVSGEQIHMDGAARALEVFGPGRFEHEGAPKTDQPGERATAKWTKGMTFDDRAGVLECRGEAVAVVFPDPMSRRTLEAETVKIEMTEGSETGVSGTPGEPGPGTAEGQPPNPALNPTPAPDRRILRATATGSDQEREGGRPANVEAVRFEPDQTVPEGRRLVEAAYLEGSTILADDVDGTLDVPGSGALLVVDRRASDGPASVAPIPEVGRLAPGGPAATPGVGAPGPRATTRGDALFRWTDSLRVERENGTMTMKGSVRLIHVSTDGAEVTELESRELVATVREMPGAGILSAEAQEGMQARRRFTSAGATGSVWVRSGRKELTADRLEYDAIGRTVRASADGDRVVTMFDPAQPTPAQAKVLFWDMGRDRVEIREPATIVVPR